MLLKLPSISPSAAAATVARTRAPRPTLALVVARQRKPSRSLRSRPSSSAIMASSNDIVRLDCGKRMSEATIHGKTVYLAGQVPEDTSKDIKGQTQEVLDAIDDLLKRSGTDKSRILMAQVFMVDLAEFPGFNEVWDAWVAQGATPARATVQVPKLADPGWKLEIVVTAALP